jgi:ribosomal protein S18 acetylase RimI-like enzyme
MGVSNVTGHPGDRVAVRAATTGDIEFMVHLFLLLAYQRQPDGEGVNVDAIVQGTRVDILKQVQGQIQDSTTYVIECGDRRAGRLRVVRTADRIEIAGLQVMPVFQRRGIGTAVITAVLDEAATRAVPVVLQVDKDNPDARRLYLRLGFRQVGETPDSFWMSVP